MIAGCDGFHGVCRPSDPGGRPARVRARVPVRLARHPRRRRAVSSDELVYAHHERGFALLSLRSPELSRLYSSARPTRTSPSGPTSASGRSCRRGSGVDGWTLPRGRSSRRASRRCAASSPSRCSTGGSSSPATPRTSCRRPARRASTSRSPTSAPRRRRSPPGIASGDRRGARRLLGRPACGGCGGPSTSRGG